MSSDVLRVLLVAIGSMLLQFVIFWGLYNHFAPIFHLPVLKFWQAAGLLFMFWMLFYRPPTKQ